MHTAITDATVRAAVTGRQYTEELRQSALRAARARADAVGSDGERGAQAAEYAMLGGVSAAACGGLVAILSRTEILETLVSTVVETLGSVVRGWF